MNEKICNDIKSLCSKAFIDPVIDFSTIKRMGGLTNFNFKICINGELYALRLPGEGTKDMINRKDEYVSTQLANKLGIDSELIYFDVENGAKIARYVIDAETMNPQSMKQHENLSKVAEVMRTLHTCKIDTNVIFDVFEMIEEYENIIRKHKITLFDDYENVKHKVQSYKEEVDSYHIERVPCHNDPLCENFVKGNETMYLIDWEYAGMNDPLWDLADISIEAGLSEADEVFLLENYLCQKPDKRMLKRLQINKVFLDFLWCLWGKVRSPYDEDLIAYAQLRYDRAKDNIRKLEKMI